MSDEYAPELFVNRQPEIDWLCDQVASVVGGSGLRERTIVYRGAKGSGKTWFLLHMSHERHPADPRYLTGRKLDGVAPVRSFYVDLNAFARGEQTSEDAVRKLALVIRDRFSGWSGPAITQPPDPADGELVTWLLASAKELAQAQPLVLFLDHVSEQPPSFLAELEKRLLAPLIALPRIALVMAERGRGYPWADATLRYYCQDVTLPPFNPTSTRDQIALLHPAPPMPDADTIWQESGGNPLANRVLAQAGTLAQAVDRMLIHVPHEDRTRLEALCVLRFCLEEHLPTMLAAYHGNAAYCGQDFATSREQMQRLVRLGYATWDKERRAWLLDAALRPLLARYLAQDQPARWHDLACAAYHLNQAWSHGYPGTGTRWRDEAAHHQTLVDLATCPDTPCPNQITGGEDDTVVH